MNTTTIDWNDPKFNDPMEEIYAIRRIISEEYGHDVWRYGAAIRQKEARAKALGMTYGQYCLAEVEGTLPLCACEAPAEYDAKPQTTDTDTTHGNSGKSGSGL